MAYLTVLTGFSALMRGLSTRLTAAIGSTTFSMNEHLFHLLIGHPFFSPFDVHYKSYFWDVKNLPTRHKNVFEKTISVIYHHVFLPHLSCLTGLYLYSSSECYVAEVLQPGRKRVSALLEAVHSLFGFCHSPISDILGLLPLRSFLLRRVT